MAGERERKLIKRYGLTLAAYDALLAGQHGKCALCGSTESKGPRSAHFFVDHDHRTGRIRGLLCYRCNTALAALGDTQEALWKALKYVRG